MAVYTQRIGEDEDDFLPSLFLTQIGLEAWGQAGDLGSLRVYLEVADTLCGGNITGSGLPNCAYNHPIYSTGMRYRGRAIGHTADNDAEIWSLGVLLNDADDHSWALTLSAGDLNREGEPDPANTVTPVKQEYVGASLVHSRSLPVGTLARGPRLRVAGHAVHRRHGRGLAAVPGVAAAVVGPGRPFSAGSVPKGKQ